MVSVKGTKKTLALAVLILIIVSILLKLYAGIDPRSAVLDTVLSGLEISYYGIPMVSASSVPVVAAKLLDTAMPPLLTLLLATMFIDAISSINIRERLAKSKTGKMKGHAIITPANGLSKALALELGNSGIKSVVIAKTKAELDDLYLDGIVGIMGDPGSIESLMAAGLSNAMCIVTCSDDDMKNALTSITAKSKAPKIRMLSIVNKKENRDKITSIGVEGIVMPELAAGEALAKNIIRNFHSTSKTKG